MSRSTPSVCGIICTGDNFPEFDAAFRDTSLEFREAGEGFEIGMMPALALPSVSAYTNSSGDIDQVTFLSDKREMVSRMRALKEDNISLLCCLLKSLSPETKDRLTSDSGYKDLRKNMDVIGIYALLEKLCVDQGSGVNSLGLIAIGFMPCSQDTLSFEKFVLKDLCIGIPKAGNDLFYNIFCFADNPKLFTDKHLTIHIGMELTKEWGDAEYRNHNEKEFKSLIIDLAPFIDITKFPGSELIFLKRHFKWLMNPTFHYPTMLKADLKQLGKKRKRKEKVSRSFKEKYFEWLINYINFD